MKKLLVLAVCAALSTTAAAATPAAIDPAHLSGLVRTLSSDAFEGRGPATDGERKTIDYVVAQFKAAGLQPGGDLKDGQRLWTQDVPLGRFAITGPMAVSVDVGGKSQALTQGERDRGARGDDR